MVVVGKSFNGCKSEKGIGLLEAAVLTALLSLAVFVSLDSLGISARDSLERSNIEIAGGESRTSAPNGSEIKRPPGGGQGILAPLMFHDIATQKLAMWYVTFLWKWNNGEFTGTKEDFIAEIEKNWIALQSDSDSNDQEEKTQSNVVMIGP